MKYQAYAEYKDSGVEMLGCVPIHWNTKQVRFLLKDGAEGIKIGPFGSALRLEDMVESGIRVYGQENVIQKDFSLGKRMINQIKFSEMKVYQIYVNDLLMTMMGTSGKCELVPEDIELGIIDSHLLRLRVKESEILPRFFRLLIDECYEIENQIKISGKGSIMHGLNSSIVKALQLPLPSCDEQEKILTFLDHETAKIDTLIEKQQQLIQLLKEKRQAVISHAVTKGLNPDVPMRDSGVEWLGEVPAHWEIKKLKYLGCARNGLTYSPDDIVDVGEEGILVLRSSNVQNMQITFDDNVYVKKIIKDSMITNINDILICSRNGSRALIGKNALIDKKSAGFAYGAFMMIYRSEINTYLSIVFNSSLFDYQSGTFLTATINQLTIENLYGFEIPIPPIEEQNEIISTIKYQTQTLDKLIAKTNLAINLMQERRTALISAAVTGKIDVRNWQPSKGVVA